MMKTILFTSVGRRVELIQAFERASKKCGIPVWLIGADLSASAPALRFCDEAVSVCRISDANYIPQLLKLCESRRVDLLIPTIDTDLLLLAVNRQRFEEIGTRVFISSEEMVRICRDKRFTAAFFHECGLASPDPVDDIEAYHAGYPCFIKPLDGSSSVDAYRVEDEEQLKAYAEKIGTYIVQPFIEGREYTIDIFCDFEGAPVYITPRERLAVRSGEVLKTQIVQDETMIAQAKALVQKFRPVGPITVQLIRQKETGMDYFIEINPRFGGGAPLSMMAGADAAEAALRLLTGEKCTYQERVAQAGLVFSRFDQCICLRAQTASLLRHVDNWSALSELVKNAVLEKGILAVIFDLDDTLYPEMEYVRSGFRAVAACIPQVIDAEQKLWSAFEQGLPAIDTVLNSEGLRSEDLRCNCLQAYRKNDPTIELYPEARALLEWLKLQSVKIGVLTDGRPEGQWAKVKALALEEAADQIIVTDELGGVQFRKPCDIAFRVMQGRLQIPYEQMLYVGDNPEKDFKAEKHLGMPGIWFENTDSVHWRNHHD
jgi:FMN phosphatase YigB (HAD superfamily)/biotin carboxylase